MFVNNFFLFRNGYLPCGGADSSGGACDAGCCDAGCCDAGCCDAGRINIISENFSHICIISPYNNASSGMSLAIVKLVTS